MLKTIGELDEDLCNYCYRTDYGEHKSGVTPNGYWSCEGSFCEEAYAAYIDENETTENIIKYATKVKLNNKEVFCE